MLIRRILGIERRRRECKVIKKKKDRISALFTTTFLTFREFQCDS